MPALITALPQLQQLVYNGYTFNASTRTTHFSVIPRLSACGRYYTHADHTLTVTTVLDPGTDPTLAQADMMAAPVIEKLTQPAGRLVLSGKGFGSIRVNVVGGKSDVKWGPLPKIDALETLGGHAKLTWTVTWATVTCADGVTSGAFPLEFVWDCGFKISKSGLTTRTVSGWVSVPATRRDPGDRRLPITADVLRERVTPALIKGFRRTNPGDFRLDYAKTKLTFSFEDVQIPTAVPPPGVIEASGKMSIAQAPNNPFQWTATLACTYTIANGATVQGALEAFFATLADRWDGWLTATGYRTTLNLIPWQFNFDDGSLYDEQQVGITFSFRINGASWKQVLQHGRLWRPLPKAHNDWGKWSASVKNHLSPRGVSNVVFSPGEDEIVDLCKPVPLDTDLRSNPRPIGTDLRSTPTPFVASLRGGMFSAPTAAGSWQDYKCSVYVEEDSAVLVGKSLPTGPIETELRGGPKGAGAMANSFRLETGAAPAARTAGELAATYGNTFVQRRTAPTVYVTLSGHGVRVGFPVPCPTLDSFDGRSVALCNRTDRGEGFEQQVTGWTANGYPIHAAKWRLRYVVTGDAKGNGKLPAAPNPLVKPVT